MLISLPIRILMFTTQALLPDIELRSDALKKEKEAESAWKLSASIHVPLSSTFNSESAAEVAPSSATPETGQGHSSDTAVLPLRIPRSLVHRNQLHPTPRQWSRRSPKSF